MFPISGGFKEFQSLDFYSLGLDTGFKQSLKIQAFEKICSIGLSRKKASSRNKVLTLLTIIKA
jgi:hypothetical protein